MYKPKYNITDYLLFLLNEVTVVEKKIQSSTIAPKWEVKFRQDALLESTHASTSIEGNSLSLKQVSQVLLDRKSIGIKREQKEVQNYYRSLTELDKLANLDTITSKNILTIHKQIMTGVMLNDSPGKWRQGAVVIGNPRTRAITYVAPAFTQVPQLIQELLDWYNTGNDYLHPVIKAAIMHYRFVWIHPFMDGNGRTARTMATLTLLREKFDQKRFIILDDYYNANRSLYYVNIQATNKSQDLTEWLEYFCEGILLSLQAVNNRIQNLQESSLSNTQQQILETIRKKSRIKSADIQALLGISKQAVVKKLNSMINQRLIIRRGKGKATYYTLKNNS